MSRNTYNIIAVIDEMMHEVTINHLYFLRETMSQWSADLMRMY